MEIDKAIEAAIQYETRVRDVYRSAAEKCDDATGKRVLQVLAFFAELADWESGHYHALLRQHEALKEEYWSKAGFAPF